MGQPAGTAEDARPTARAGAGARRAARPPDQPPVAEGRQGVPVPQAPDQSGRGAEDPGAQDSRRVLPARVPPLLPAGAGDGPRAGLHQHRRPRPGRAGTGVRRMAQRHAGRAEGDPRQPRPHRRERRSDPLRAAGQGPDAEHRPPHPVPGAPRAAQCAARAPGQQRFHRDHGRDHRRSAGDGQPAHVQPQRDRPGEAGRAAQPRADGHDRARLHDEAPDRVDGAEGRRGHALDAGQHQSGLHGPEQPLHHPRRAPEQRRADRHRRHHEKFEHRLDQDRREAAQRLLLRKHPQLRLRAEAR